MVANCWISFVDFGAKLFGGHAGAGIADERELLREEMIFSEVVERGDEFSLGEIAGAPKITMTQGSPGRAETGLFSAGAAGVTVSMGVFP